MRVKAWLVVDSVPPGYAAYHRDGRRAAQVNCRISETSKAKAAAVTGWSTYAFGQYASEQNVTAEDKLMVGIPRYTPLDPGDTLVKTNQ